MKPELCLLIGATEEQRSNYLKLVEKYTSSRFAETYWDCLDHLRNNDYVVTEPPTESIKSVINLAKEWGAEVVGVFFNSAIPKNNGFDRIIYEEMVV